MTIVIIDTNKFREYSKYLGFILKIYMVLIVIIALFGGYKILTNYTPPKKMTPPPVQLDF